MKTFVSSMLIFALLCVLVFSASAFVKERLRGLAALAADLPASNEEFAKESDLKGKAERLRSLWTQSMVFFPYIMGYDMLDRADDAVLSLCAAAEAESREELFAARLRFLDALSRLDTLFGLSAESIA